MTIHQLKDRCWTLEPNPWGDSDCGIPHHKTWAEASEALAELRKERGPDPRDLADLERVRPEQGESPCWIAECDSPGCEETYSDEDSGGEHYGSADSLMTWMTADGWTTGVPDKAYCYGDAEGGTPPPPSPAELEAAGQLRFPGVA